MSISDSKATDKSFGLITIYYCSYYLLINASYTLGLNLDIKYSLKFRFSFRYYSLVINPANLAYFNLSKDLLYRYSRHTAL